MNVRIQLQKMQPVMFTTAAVLIVLIRCTLAKIGKQYIVIFAY